MIEHRLPSRLTAYWERIRQQNPVPPFEKFNPEVVSDLWPKCFSVSIFKEGNKPTYIYDFIGADLEGIFGKGLAGQRVKARLGFLPAAKMMEQMDKSITNPFPITVEGQFIDFHSKVIKYRSCLLPFGKSREQISHFVIGLSWKSF